MHKAFYSTLMELLTSHEKEKEITMPDTAIGAPSIKDLWQHFLRDTAGFLIWDPMKRN